MEGNEKKDFGKASRRIGGSKWMKKSFTYLWVKQRNCPFFPLDYVSFMAIFSLEEHPNDLVANIPLRS